MFNKQYIKSGKNSRRTIAAITGDTTPGRLRISILNRGIHRTVMELLAQRGYRNARPEEIWIFQSAPFVSSFGVNEYHEMSCVQVRKPDCLSDRGISWEDRCNEEIPLLVSLLTVSCSDTYIRCEIRVSFRSEGMLCVKVTPDGLTQMPDTSIRPPVPCRIDESAAACPAGCVAGESPALLEAR